MKRRFLKVQMMSDRVYRDAYVDLSSVIAFRESPYDVNVTIVYTVHETFVVRMELKEFCKEIGIDEQSNHIID